MRTAARLLDVTHVYEAAGSEGPITALNEVDLSIQPGETVSLVGPSGSGKSTLMTLIAGLARPTSGHVMIGNQVVSTMSERELLRLRAEELGVVLQSPGRNLLPYATAAQNVVFAQRRRGVGRRERKRRAHDLLESVGLSAHVDRPARLLSGGQQQRLAVAIALAARPALLLADEPTSQLPHATGEEVVRLMLGLCEEHGSSLLVVTHDRRVADMLDTVYRLADGDLLPEAKGS